jgi:hypothetical protein
LANFDSFNKGKFGSIVFLPFFVVLFGVLGFASPVFFGTVSEDTLKDIGEGSKTIDQETLRQLRQNNLGPAEMLLPLTSLSKQKKFREDIEAKKKDHPELAISGGGSIFDMLTYDKYFGGLDDFNKKRGRFEAFFVYNRATTRGDLWERLKNNSSNDNVQAILQSIPAEGRPGNFWTRLLEDPLVSTFPGVKLAELQGFAFFPNRRVILSAGVRNPTEIEVNATEAEIRDLCLEEARSGFADFSGEIESFVVMKEGSDAKVSRLDGNVSLAKLDFAEFALRAATLKMGRTGDGGYAVIIGGVIDPRGKLENHGRWLPYPMLVPMMVGTAMSLEKDYYSSDAAYEIGRLSQQMLLGDLESKERIRSFYWAAHQLARKMNFMQMAELTQSCPDLQAVFDLAGLIRMRNGPLAEAAGKIKSAKRNALFPSVGQEVSPVDFEELEHNKTKAEKKFEEDLRIIYAATLLSGDSSAVLKFVESYPVYDKEGDKIAAEAALEDIKLAMSYGSESLRHLLARNQPIHRKGPVLAFVSSVFPLFGGNVITHLSHSHHSLALFLKLTLLGAAFFCLLLFVSQVLPKPEYKRTECHFALRWTRRFSAASLWGLLTILALEPTLLQTPRGQVSVAGFDFALANLLAYANEESMAEQNLTGVTAIIAGTFLAVQIVIFMVCLSRISQVKNEEMKPGLKLNLLDNEENLFDLGLYVGLGGTVLSLILLLVLGTKNDALIGAYTSTLFGILFVAALKIFVVRPYRNHLLVKQAEEKRYEP